MLRRGASCAARATARRAPVCVSACNGPHAACRQVAANAQRAAALQRPQRWSHPDFAPQGGDGGSQNEKEEIMAEMRKDIKDIPCVLFMKGEPEAPRCGFSGRTIDLLKAYGVAYTSYNVLAHPAVRDGVKEISGWPTIPQFFVKGEFVGGCDLLHEMHQSGDLSDLFKKNGITFKDPKSGEVVQGGSAQGLEGQ
eukprot:TRINITY_DN6847_c0_g1_i1.p2 TRINITY_DN6847_c0_g1~~TRINITY_DN6847_c0_g1_i1.p2  ORF type:complete len:195 (+),score=59.37 TRINITY_DN6847_c0_g1_i1:77-661(+)